MESPILQVWTYYCDKYESEEHDLKFMREFQVVIEGGGAQIPRTVFSLGEEQQLRILEAYADVAYVICCAKLKRPFII